MQTEARSSVVINLSISRLAAKILVAAAAVGIATQAMAQYYNPRALNPQPLPPGIYAPSHPHPAIACRRVCTQTRNLGPATAPQCIRWRTIC
ncbi:MAG TPA: hypothetical protein VH684_29545 [Xanthobacteraceae bacterium]|jgi:hypothetical protein